jgi:hypothetical protein
MGVYSPNSNKNARFFLSQIPRGSVSLGGFRSPVGKKRMIYIGKINAASLALVFRLDGTKDPEWRG